MNFAFLVENGDYKKEDLSEKGQAVIDGMERAMESADSFLGCYDPDGCTDTLERIKAEVAKETIEEFKKWLYRDICRAIVEMADEEYCQKHGSVREREHTDLPKE